MPLITNVMGSTAQELCALVEALDDRDEVDALELNVSCPNVTTGLDIGADPTELGAVLRQVRPRTAKPLIVKLTPNTADVAAVAQAAQEAGADAVSLINTLRAYRTAPATAPARPGWATRPAGCRAPPSARWPSRRCARSPRASRSRSSGWAASRAAYTPRTCSRRARRSSPWAPRAFAIRPREHGSHASLTICSQRAGQPRLIPETPTIDLAESPANRPKTVKQSGSTSTSGRGRGEFALFRLPAVSRCVVSPTDAAGHQFPYQALGGTQRSLLQRMDALQRANEIRTRRAQLKKDLKAGRVSIHTLLKEPPEYVETAKVFDMLLAVPKYGRVKANKVLQQCRISPSKTIGGLSERQRTELVGLLRR